MSLFKNPHVETTLALRVLYGELGVFFLLFFSSLLSFLDNHAAIPIVVVFTVLFRIVLICLLGLATRQQSTESEKNTLKCPGTGGTERGRLTRMAPGVDG